MKKLYHVCMTSHGESLLRNEEDLVSAVNLMAISAFSSQSEILVDEIMSDHCHMVVRSECPAKFAKTYKMSLGKSFNERHSRTGSLFDPNVFISELDGFRHIETAITYVLRNPVHHGVTATPFEYPCGTAPFLFARERGVMPAKNPGCKAGGEGIAATGDRSFIKSCFPKNARIPETVLVGPDGMAYRPSFEQIATVENYYGSVRKFIYDMNRFTSEEWLAEQEQDGMSLPRVTLGSVEGFASGREVEKMLGNESGRNAGRHFSDMEVCRIIDEQMLPRYRKSSVYQLELWQKVAIFNELFRDLHIPQSVLRRCLAMCYYRR